MTCGEGVRKQRTGFRLKFEDFNRANLSGRVTSLFYAVFPLRDCNRNQSNPAATCVW